MRESNRSEPLLPRALFYLGAVLLRRRALRYLKDLRRPTRLVGAAALGALAGFLFYYRDHEFFDHLARPPVLAACALVMLGGALYRGFCARGLAFEPADAVFLFAGPFSTRQIILHRLWPQYLFALGQAAVFLGLLGPHLARPVTAALCFLLFQIACFHVATVAAFFGGRLSEECHHRVRWMILAGYLLISALYLRAAWDIRLVPPLLAGAGWQWLFYPAVSLPDLASWAVAREGFRRVMVVPGPAVEAWKECLCLAGFALAAGASLRWALHARADFLESSLATTLQAAERKIRVRDGRRVAVLPAGAGRSRRLPRGPFFRGIGAMVWKNLVVAGRSRRELILALGFTVVFTVPLAALLRLHEHFQGLLTATGARESDDGFELGVILFLGFLPFLLQRTLPFDFRLDGHHLAGLRSLPAAPIGIVLAELAVPTTLCLLFQAVGLGALLFCAGLKPAALLLAVFGYPAVALAVNGIWNLHYLLSAARRAGGRPQPPTAVGALMVTALSFLMFYPAGWTAVTLFDRQAGLAIAAAGGLAVQYTVDALLVAMLAALFRQFEGANDSA